MKAVFYELVFLCLCFAEIHSQLYQKDPKLHLPDNFRCTPKLHLQDNFRCTPKLPNLIEGWAYGQSRYSKDRLTVCTMPKDRVEAWGAF